jgi:hypothetical protein
VNRDLNKRDLPWIAIILVSFVLALAVSWQRWGNPLVDCGREMNQPARLANGEMLYSDIRHIYGPLSPYLNAGLYKLFGPSLNALYADGIVSALLILALTYWLARQLMTPAGSAAATLSVLWLCAFKQAGNYILPYSYSALHGCALGLVSLALVVKSLRANRHQSRELLETELSPVYFRYLFLAGLFSGLTMLCKTEMGLAALMAGVVTSMLAGYPRFSRTAGLVAAFIGPALVVTVGTYALIAVRVGWQTLSNESFLFLSGLPSELVYFNKRVSGFDAPVQSLLQMLVTGVRLAIAATAVGTASVLLNARRPTLSAIQPAAAVVRSDGGHVTQGQLTILLLISLLASFVIPISGLTGWDRGPYLAMPLMLLALLSIASLRIRNDLARRNGMRMQSVVTIAVSVYALASLARVILRVRSGGAYSSYLLPASIILFVYGWAYLFAEQFRNRSAARLVTVLWLGLIFIDVLGTAPLIAYRFRERNTYRLSTPRGTMIAVPDLGQAVDEATKYILNNTGPEEPVAVLPEGTSLNFFTGRRNPLREEITTPGFLDLKGEQRAIAQIESSNTRLIMITNRATPEFGASVLGRDYCRDLFQWVEANFDRVAVFGPDKSPDLEIGDRTFFIRAYRRKDSSG